MDTANSLADMGLAPEAIAHFRAFGFVVRRGALDAGEVAALRTEAIVAVRDATGDGYLREDPDGGIQGHYIPAMGERTPLGLGLLERFAGVAAEVLDVPVLPALSQHTLFLDGAGWHSDTGHQVPSVKVVAYLEPLDETNGALRVLPGSHHPGVYERTWPYLIGADFRHADAWRAATAAVPGHVVTTEPGDVIVFDEHLLHASVGGRHRLQWSAVYVVDPRDAAEADAVRAWLAGQFSAGGNLGYDVGRFPYFGDHFRRTFPAKWVRRLEELGAFDAAALEEHSADPANRAIHTETIGTGASRLILIHGFTQTGRSWRRVTADLAADHEVVVVDAPGHGGSSHVIADLWSGAHCIADAAGDGIYVGYSMGARFALFMALTRPSAVKGLVLLGANPGVEDHRERNARARADEALATDLERDGVDAFLDRWLAQPLLASLPRDAADVADRRRNRAAGLASSLRHAGAGAQEPVWDRVQNIGAPVLVLAGEHDAKFRAIGERLAAAIGTNATFAVVPDAGHAAHLEQPEAFTHILRSWLAEWD